MRCAQRRHRLDQVRVLEDRLAPAILDFGIAVDQSTLSFTGTLAGQLITAQSSSSLVSAMFGNLRVGVDFDAGFIQFLTDSGGLTAATSGSCTPLQGGLPGSKAANFGGAVTSLLGSLAMREFGGALESAAIPLAGVGATRSFAPNLELQVSSGRLDFSLLGLGFGSTNLTGVEVQNAGAAAGVLSDMGDGTARLAIPLDLSINASLLGLPLSSQLKGVLVAETQFPALDLNGADMGTGVSIAFTPGTGSVLAAPFAIIHALPATNIHALTLTLTNRPDGAAEGLAVNLAGTDLLTTTYNPSTGQLTITGPAPASTYQAVLQTLTYLNNLSNPTSGDRLISVTVGDGIAVSLAQLITINVGQPRPTVVTTEVNAGAEQRSMVNQAEVSFNTTVQFAGDPSSAIVLTRDGGGPVNLSATASTVDGVTVLMLSDYSGLETVHGSLIDGLYTLRIRADQISSSGGSLDGNGDGTAGDDAVFHFHRLFGDADGDRDVDTADYSAIRTAFNGTNVIFDYDNDGDVDASDYGQFRVRFGMTI